MGFPKLVAFATAALSDGNGPTKALLTSVSAAMKKKRGMVISSSGRTAALAMNYCERNNLDYDLTRIEGRYSVKRKK